MGDKRNKSGRFAGAALAVSLAIPLSGCIAAAVPLAYAAIAATSGFEAYKVVQTSTGGSIHVGFVGQDGKENPPQPLPTVRRVAVWPSDEGNVRFAEKLSASGRFDVTPPARVAVILAGAKMATDLTQLTEREQVDAFETVCQESHADLIFASRALGSSVNANTFSLSRANTTSRADLFAFSCAKRSIIWRDQIALVIDLGEKVPSTAEIAQAGGDAWAERVMQAPTI